MSVARISAGLIGIVIIAACTTPEGAARLSGVRPDDAREIARVVHVDTSADILSYTRQPDGSVEVRLRSTNQDPRFLVVHRLDGRWQVNRNVIVEF